MLMGVDPKQINQKTSDAILDQRMMGTHSARIHTKAPLCLIFQLIQLDLMVEHSLTNYLIF